MFSYLPKKEHHKISKKWKRNTIKLVKNVKKHHKIGKKWKRCGGGAKTSNQQESKKKVKSRK